MHAAELDRRLRLAAVYDVSSPAWQAFYPEGLPEDWRLAYYGHYWKAVLVAAADGIPGPVRTNELAELSADFRVYFEMPAVAPADSETTASALSAQMGDRLGGFLVSTATPWRPAGIRAEQLFLPRPAPVLEGIRTLRCFGSPVAIMLVLEPEPGLGLKAWRALLESLRDQVPNSNMLVFLRAAPREIEDAETILRLTGLDQPGGG